MSIMGGNTRYEIPPPERAIANAVDRLFSKYSDTRVIVGIAASPMPKPERKIRGSRLKLTEKSGVLHT
jgi:hypothetical protein